MSNNLILVDRSRCVTDWQCPRRRYLNYDYEGKGIAPASAALELQMGIILHDSLAAIATSHPDVDIDAIAHKAYEDMFAFLMKGSPNEAEKLFAIEQATLVEGLLRGFYKHQWPRLIAQYPKILAIEQEMSYAYGRILYMSKPDLVAVDKNGEVTYIEYKSTSTKREEWIASWETAIQLHSTTRAIEHALGERIGHIVVQGLYKGSYSYGKQGSVFCYCYKRSGQPPFSRDEISYEYKAGFKRFPVWELEGGVKAWVERMPEDVLSEQFPVTPPIFVNDDQVEAFFAQRNVREQEIEMAKGILSVTDDKETHQLVLNTSFPQRFDQCSPAWGKPCPYKRICFGQVDKPLEQGFEWRQPHHAIEDAFYD